MYEEIIGALKKCGYPGDVHYCRDCVFANDGGACRMKKLLPAAADAIEELSREKESLAKSVNEASEILRRRWIPVTERLPEISVPVLAYVYWPEDQDTMICYGTRKKTRWFLTHCEEGELLRGYEVTHWMPLPEPQKEKTECLDMIQ